MKLLNFKAAGLPGSRFGVGLDTAVVDLAAWDERNRQPGGAISRLPASVDDYLVGDASSQRTVRQLADAIAADGPLVGVSGVFSHDDVTWLPPVLRPGKILAAGRNYGEHRAEAERTGLATEHPSEGSAVPTGFVKVASTLIGHRQAIVVPEWIEDVDYESELVAIIGRRADGVSEEDALEYVAGFTVGNDVSARRLQRAEHQSGGGPLVGKNPRTFGPMGPWLVTSDEIGDPMCQHVWSKVNGEIRQDALTTDMIFDLRRLIAWFSTVGLDPGDVILTGTPAGIGAGGKGFLKAGDVVTCGIDAIGVLENPLKRGSWLATDSETRGT